MSEPPVLDEATLRIALHDGRFELHFQPQYECRSGRLVGVEGLVRLRLHDGVLVPPAGFLELIEQTELVHDLGLYLFEVGCRHAVAWQTLTVAINVSPAQFRKRNLAAKLIEIAAKTGVDPQRLEIEVTEGLFFDDPGHADAELRDLQSAGFGIALDDFGTGYSSLGYLLRFPVNKLKIDRSFIVGLPDDLKSVTIVHALVALARSLGLKVVAEGVETEPQRELLRVAGCHILQGHLLSRAVPPSEIQRLLDRGQAKADLRGPAGYARSHESPPIS